jgi:hypothetical protein
VLLRFPGLSDAVPVNRPGLVEGPRPDRVRGNGDEAVRRRGACPAPTSAADP